MEDDMAMQPLTELEKTRVGDNFRAVFFAANKVRRQWEGRFDYDEAIDQATKLLMRLSKSFRPEKSRDGEAGFGSYAVYWMCRSLYKAMKRFHDDSPETLFTEVVLPTNSANVLDFDCDTEYAKRHLGFRKYDRVGTKHLHPDTLDQLRLMYLRGDPTADILRECGIVNIHTLYYWRNRLGLPKRKRKNAKPGAAHG